MEIRADGYGKTKESVDYWVHHRSSLSGLYSSEKHFFIPTIKSSKKVLDIGCAAGGSALFSREANSVVEYIGIDISEEMVKAADDRLSHLPQTKFLHFNGKEIPLSDNSVDFCFSFGVFHHLNHWKEMVDEAIRVSSKYVLFDIRSWEQETLIDNKKSYQKLALGGEWDQKSIIPYNIISMNELTSILTHYCDKGISAKCFGYHQKPTSLAVTPAKKVLMLSILLEKNAAQPEIELKFT